MADELKKQKAGRFKVRCRVGDHTKSNNVRVREGEYYGKKDGLAARLVETLAATYDVPAELIELVEVLQLDLPLGVTDRLHWFSDKVEMTSDDEVPPTPGDMRRMTKKDAIEFAHREGIEGLDATVSAGEFVEALVERSFDKDGNFKPQKKAPKATAAK